MEKPFQKYNYVESFFLILFLSGILLLGFIEDNIEVLYIVVPLLLPFIFIVICEYFGNKNNEKRKNNSDEILIDRILKTGIPITINFEKAVRNIDEQICHANEDIEMLQDYIFPFKDLFNNKTEQIFTSVELKYKIERKTFFKKIVFPFSKQSTMSILRMQKSTILYYDQESPQESIIDLKFIDEYIY